MLNLMFLLFWDFVIWSESRRITVCHPTRSCSPPLPVSEKRFKYSCCSFLILTASVYYWTRLADVCKDNILTAMRTEWPQTCTENCELYKSSECRNVEAEKLRHKNVSCPLINTRALSSDNTAAGRGGWKEWTEGRIRFISFSHPISSALRQKECAAHASARLNFCITWCTFCIAYCHQNDSVFCFALKSSSSTTDIKWILQGSRLILFISILTPSKNHCSSSCDVRITSLAPNTDICHFIQPEA